MNALTLPAHLLERWAPPTDQAEERFKKLALVGVSILISILSTWWVVMYWILGVRASAGFPFFYQVASLVGIAHYTRTGRFDLFARSQLAMWLILPVLLQWTLGGFVNSSAVVLWSILAPLGALLFEGPSASGPWATAYLAVVIASGVADARLALPAPPLPAWFVLTNFVMNIGTISVVAYAMLRYLAGKREEAAAALRLEHARSEGLLLNILPRAIAERLKQHPGVIADGFPEATVVFADIVDFTRLSAQMHPDRMVAWLNELFSAFDRLSERHGLEKIKTVGDAYMAVAGVPVPRPDHARAAAEMALAIQAELAQRRTPNGEPLRMRIGLHCGPVVAGVIGTRKFIYDLWGDTVNTASRMESHGLAGTIQVTEAAYQRLKDAYVLEERGVIPVKGKGEMRTYLLTGRRSP